MLFRLLWALLWLGFSDLGIAQGVKDWQPKASLSCDEYISESKSHSFFARDKVVAETLIRRDSELASLLIRIRILDESTDKDLAYFTNSADFNPTNQWSLASIALMLSLYCTTHKNTILRDIDPLDVVRHPMGFIGDRKAQLMDASAWYKDAIATCGKNSQCSAIANSYREHTSACLLHGGSQAACEAVKKDTNDWVQLKSGTSPISSNDPTLSKWVADSLSWCGANVSCATIVKSYQAHTVACSQGNQQSCVDRDRDLRDWDAMSAGNGGAPQTSEDVRMQCLQQALKRVMDYCNKSSCQDTVKLSLVRTAQQAQCGFSAIDEPKPYVAPSQQFPTISNCTFTQRAGGAVDSTCTNY